MRKKLTIIALFSIVLAVALYVWLAPTPKFYSDEKIVELIMNYDNDIEVDVEGILAVYEIDDTHRYVPFQVKSGVQGMSFWEFRYFKWEIIRFDIGEEITLWNLKQGDFNESFFVWNIRGNDMQTLSMQVKEKRNFESSEEGQRYYPEIYLEENISIKDSLSYGYYQIPGYWAEAIQSQGDNESENEIEFWPDLNSQYYPEFYFEVRDPKNNTVETIRMDGAYGFSTSIGDSTFHFVNPANQMDNEE